MIITFVKELLRFYLNKVVLEYIPRYGQKLADEVRKWGAWVKEEAEKELSQFYPKDADGATPIAYLWARTIICEGPGCGAEVPLMRSLWLAKKASRSVALRFVVDKEKKRVDFDIIKQENKKWVSQTDPEAKIENPKSFDGTVKRGSAMCPVCGYTTPVASVRKQMKPRRGGASDARLFCVVTTRASEQGRFYRLPTKQDLKATHRATEELKHRQQNHKGKLSLVPDEPTPKGGGSGAGRAFSQRNYGMDTFEDLFTPRQALALTTLARLVREAGTKISKQHEQGFADAVQTCLALAVDRQADYLSSLTIWANSGEFIAHTFGRQALPIVWEFPECQTFANGSGNWDGAVEWISLAIEALTSNKKQNGTAEQASATESALPDDSVYGFITDPPYYDAVPYADLSDFFYVWLKRTLPDSVISSFKNNLAPKEEECIVDEVKGKDRAYFEQTMGQSMAEGRRVLHPSGIGLVVFAHKSTAGWEAQLQAIVDAGWVVTGSWAIDTERPGRLRAQNSAALASSIHIVVRPRENEDGSLREDDIGDWRDVLRELPVRLHEWMPRLAEEGIVGADAIFACLGPALEIFSRYSRVEKASGEQVTLREYLEYVWAAVAKEALNMIFKDADATGFEADARLTAMWLWTLNTKDEGGRMKDEESEDDDSNDEDQKPKTKVQGFTLEYDAARKIAQGLGAYLEQMDGLVEIKGDKARLLSVAERTKHLFGKDESETPTTKRKKKDPQMSFFQTLEDVEETTGSWGQKNAPRLGDTILDRIHQSMILFAAGRSEAMRRFLVDEGVGNDERFWRLANALSALYPSGSDEKRWVDGVLARKKGLGF